VEHLEIRTIGHSTRSIEEFLAILAAHRIGQLVDIRTIPRSRHNPPFDRANLPASITAADIRYRHMPGLGGLRRAKADSINTGWRNVSFRGFADYMQTPEFHDNLEQLIEYSTDVPTAIMCAEAVPWRCHRSLIADALVARGIPVLDIFNMTDERPHEIKAFARVDGTEVTYPGVGQKAENLELKFDGPDAMS
jgi:uncharacterized protein (DUF488 family)